MLQLFQQEIATEKTDANILHILSETVVPIYRITSKKVTNLK
jgi:hypothetical protein